MLVNLCILFTNFMKIIEVKSTRDNLVDFYKNHTQEIFGLLSLIISTLILVTLAFKQPKKVNSNCVSYEEIDNHEKTQEVVKQMLDITQASRVVVALVHNSCNTDTIPFKEFSIVYEATQIEVSSLKTLIRKIPITDCFIDKELKHLTPIKFNKYYRGQLSLSLACINYLKKRGIHTKYSRLLTNKKGIFGIIEIQYLEEPTLDWYSNQDKLSQLEECYSNLKVLLKEGNLDTVFL